MGGETKEEWTIYGFFLPLPSLPPLMLDEKSAGRSDTEEERAHMSFLPSSGFVLASVRDSAMQRCRLERRGGEDGSSVAEGQTMKPDRSPLHALSFDKLVSSSSWSTASFRGQQMQLGEGRRLIGISPFHLLLLPPASLFTMTIKCKKEVAPLYRAALKGPSQVL